MSLKSYYYNADGLLQQDLTEDEIAAAVRSGKGLVWVDSLETDTGDTDFFERVFGFHRLAVEDCLSTRIHPPKIDQFGDYIFIIVHGINHAVESDIVETAELALFLGPNYLVTSHGTPLYSIAGVSRTVEENGRTMKNGADFLLHMIIDALVDNVMPTIDRMNDVADELEEEVIRLRATNILDGIMKLKRSAMKVHRIMAPQREVLNRLSRAEFSQIGQDAQIFFRDIYDHVMRIEDLNQNTLDRADTALATYLSSVANRQNETMRVLSIVATIFMPLTLLVGIYGMNFNFMPELTWKWGYFMVLGVIVIVILVLVWRFWAGGWIRRRSRIAWVKPFTVETSKLRGHLPLSHKRKSTETIQESAHEADE